MANKMRYVRKGDEMVFDNSWVVCGKNSIGELMLGGPGYREALTYMRPDDPEWVPYTGPNAGPNEED